VGEDKPFSLFLASGIPFEVIDELTDEGWIFLSNEDARSVVEGRVMPKNNNLVVRKEANVKDDSFIYLRETMEGVFTFKESIISSLKNIPYVAGNTPVIFSWFPSADRGILWNVNEEEQKFNIVINDKIIKTVTLDGLDVALVAGLK
jgi:hypothetical protein